MPQARQANRHASQALLLSAGVLVSAAVQAGSSREHPHPAPHAPSALPEAAVVSGVPLTSLRIAGAALTPRESDVTRAVSGSGGCAYASGGDANTVWSHKVPLPQGAIVSTLRMYYNDTSASNASAWLTVYDLYGSIVDEWSVSSSGNAGNGFNDSATFEHEIDYSVHAYLINWRPVVTGATMQLCGFRLFYVEPVLFRNGFELGE